MGSIYPLTCVELQLRQKTATPIDFPLVAHSMPPNFSAPLRSALQQLADSGVLGHPNFAAQVRTRLEQVSVRLPIILLPHASSLTESMRTRQWTILGLSPAESGSQILYVEYRNAHERKDLAIRLPETSADATTPPLQITADYRSQEFVYPPGVVTESPDHHYWVKHLRQGFEVQMVGGTDILERTRGVSVANSGRTVSYSNFNVFVKNFQQSPPINIVGLSSGWITDAVISESGRIAAVISGSGLLTTYRIHDSRGLRAERIGTWRDSYVYKVFLSKRGDRILVHHSNPGGNSSWSIQQTDYPSIPLTPSLGSIIALQAAAFSPDNSQLITVDMESINLWNADTGDHLRTLGRALPETVAVWFEDDWFEMARYSHGEKIRESAPVTVIQPGASR